MKHNQSKTFYIAYCNWTGDEIARSMSKSAAMREAWSSYDSADEADFTIETQEMFWNEWGQCWEEEEL